jgi:hypothetical protein
MIISPEQSDIFISDGRTKPYTLSWRPIIPGSEKITIDNRADLGGLAVRFAYDNGTLQLGSAPAQAIVRVEYRIDPAVAVRNPIRFTLPVSFDLADRGWANARMDLVYNDEDIRSDEDTGSLLVGLGVGADLSRQPRLSLPGTISADFFARIKPGAVGDTSDLSDRSAMRLAGDFMLGELGLSVGVTRAGEAFDDAKQRGMAQGYETRSVSARYAGGHAEVTSSIVQQEDIRDETAGAQKTDQAHQVEYALGGGARIGLSHRETALESRLGELTGMSVRDALSLAQDISGLGSVSVRREWTGSPLDPNQDAVVSTYGISAAPMESWSMTAMIIERDSAAGTGQAQDVGLTITPAGRLRGSIKLHHDESSDCEGAQFSTGITYNAGAGTTVASAMSRVRSDAGCTDLYDLSVSSKPVGEVDFAGGYAMRRTEVPGMEDWERSMDMSVRLALPANLSLTGGYALRPRDKLGAFQPLEQQSAALGWRFGPLDLATGFTLYRREDTELDSFKREINLGYRLGESARVTLGLAEGVEGRSWTDPRTGVDTRTWSMGFTHRYTSDRTLSLKGYWTDRIDRGDANLDPDYRVELNAGFRF